MPNSLSTGQFICVTAIPFLQNCVLKNIVSALIISTIMKSNSDVSLGFTINDVARLLRWTFDRQSQDIGLTRAQWSVLAHLSRRNGVQQSVLAKVMEITPITLGRHLDRLEKDNWIERRDSPEDRRAKCVFLNPAASPVLEQLARLGQTVREQALQGISAAEEEQFMQVLLKIRKNLSAAQPNCSSHDTQ